MIMTKRSISSKQHAVLKSYVLWANLAQTGKNKESYPLFDELNMVSDMAYCSLCTYAEGICVNCPMCDRWPAQTAALLPTCNSIGSAYGMWADGDKAESKLGAGQIATALWKLYKEIEIK
jgi:hypothetical protein